MVHLCETTINNCLWLQMAEIKMDFNFKKK